MSELSRAKNKSKHSISLATEVDGLAKRQKRAADDDLYPTELSTIRQPLTSQTKESRPIRNQLCQRCTKLDIDSLLSRQHKTRRGLPVAALSPVAQWKIGRCPLCSLLYSTLSPQPANVSDKQPLRSLSSNKIKSTWWKSIKTNFLELDNGRRCIVSQPDGLNGPIKIIGKKIDNYEIVKDWINLCRNHHTMSCSVGDAPSIPSLRLIDCKTGELVPATNHPYVALSYVWGLSSETSKEPDKLPDDLPCTIKDAMTVTNRLDFRYLWVDRYCINQQRKEDVAEQVGQMDLIYQNAELTIIAAAGDNPTYGLPGVCERERKPHNLTTCAKIGRNFLISLDPYLTSLLAGTKWETRAWTYQEGLLSRRRLVFAEEQMYFECYGMYCCESINLPTEQMHRQDMQGFKSDFCEDNHVGIFPKGVGSTSLEVFRRIEEYSTRSLGNPTDILKGMLGIFNAFERNRLGIKQCSGIPILPSMPTRGKSIEAWTPAMGFLAGMFWDLKERTGRRPGFPSWSWTGWQGPVTWTDTEDTDWPSIKVDPNAQLSIELIDGRVLKWEDFQNSTSKANLDLHLSNFVRLTTWTTRLQIRKRDRQKDKDEYTAKVNLEDGGYLYWKFKSISNLELLRGQICTGIILGHSIKDISMRPTGPAILVVCQIGHAVERIGFGWVDQFEYERYSKDSVREIKKYLWENPMYLEPFTIVTSWEEIRLG
ncbi:heterokaryon incompatibility protein-domain-containing protein [Cadophora sp. MPI-SDFR-AT-0126]|nr:heterokaryon incompatibility protein-domain-containing protein [Leotiomycetes sp. MPI-SDFR-AT-0126]